MKNNLLDPVLFRRFCRVIEREMDATQATSAARGFFHKYDMPFVPIGTGNSKTQLPSTYRKVGDTCPKDCPFLHSICQATKGNVQMHQRRADTAVMAAVNSAIAGMVISLYHLRVPPRLHVSGDFVQVGTVDAVDWVYVALLTEGARLVKQRYPFSVVAYSYTQIKTPEAVQMINMFREQGIEIVRSNVPVVGGAVVWKHEDVAALRERYPETKFAKCPAQNSKWMSCRTCGICWKTTQLNLCVVFKPEHAKKHKLDYSAILDKADNILSQEVSNE